MTHIIAMTTSKRTASSLYQSFQGYIMAALQIHHHVQVNMVLFMSLRSGRREGRRVEGEGREENGGRKVNGEREEGGRKEGDG